MWTLIAFYGTHLSSRKEGNTRAQVVVASLLMGLGAAGYWDTWILQYF
jgi:hypothetical protein